MLSVQVELRNKGMCKLFARCWHIIMSIVLLPPFVSILHYWSFHYGKPAICRVPESLPSVFYRALGKDRVCRVPNKIHSANKNTRQNTSLPSVFFLTLGKDVFCRVLFFGTRQNTSLPSVFFWHSAKMYFAECLCFGTRQRGILPCVFFFGLVFQSNFWGPKWIQMKNFSTTKLYNFSRSTKFILVIYSFDKATITLFIKSTSLILVSWK